jgi:hypothetical protein
MSTAPSAPLAPPQPRTPNLVQRHPLASFFVLTYAISWLLMSVVAGDRSVIAFDDQEHYKPLLERSGRWRRHG